MKMFEREWYWKKKIFPLKELWVIFHNVESTKHKMLEADTDVDRSMTICQRLETMLASCPKLYS